MGWCKRQNLIVIRSRWRLQIKPVSYTKLSAILVAPVSARPRIFLPFLALPWRHNLAALFRLGIGFFTGLIGFSFFAVSFDVNTSIDRLIILHDHRLNGSVSALSIGVNVNIVLVEIVEGNRMGDVIDIMNSVVDRLNVVQNVVAASCASWRRSWPGILINVDVHVGNVCSGSVRGVATVARLIAPIVSPVTWLAVA